MLLAKLVHKKKNTIPHQLNRVGHVNLNHFKLTKKERKENKDYTEEQKEKQQFPINYL